MTTHGPARPIEILMVEDNPADARLMREALGYGLIASRLHVVGDGEAGISFLRREGPYASAPGTDLVLLDLNLPRKDGRELLEEIKSDAVLRRIPVVVLTSSNAEQDIARAYDLHANCYIRKPLGLDPFLGVGRAIESFWLSVVTLPPAVRR